MAYLFELQYNRAGNNDMCRMVWPDKGKLTVSQREQTVEDASLGKKREKKRKGKEKNGMERENSVAEKYSLRTQSEISISSLSLVFPLRRKLLFSFFSKPCSKIKGCQMNNTPCCLHSKSFLDDRFVEPLGARWKEGVLISIFLSLCSLMDFLLYSTFGMRVQDCVVQTTFRGYSYIDLNI